MTTRADMLRNPSTYTVAMALIQRCLARRAIPAAKATTQARIAEKSVTSRVILIPEKRASARVITSDIGILLTTRRARMLYLMLVIEPGGRLYALHTCAAVTWYAPVTVTPVKPNGSTSFNISPLFCIAANCWLNCVTREASDLRKPYPPAVICF